MFTRRIGLLVTSIVLLAAPATAHATTRTVCASGCDFTDIQLAIDASGSGDTVQLGAGSYSGSFDVHTPVNIVGAGASTVVTGPSSDTAFYVDAAAVTISNMAIVAGDLGAGVYVTTGTVGATLSGLSVSTAPLGSDAIAVWLDGTGLGAVQVLDSDLAGAATGLWVESGTTATSVDVHRNRIHYLGSDASIPVSATDNFFACHTGAVIRTFAPSTTGACAMLAGTGIANVTVIPYLTPIIDVVPPAWAPTRAYRVRLVRNTDGTSPGPLPGMNAVPVKLASTDLVLVNGEASVPFTAADSDTSNRVPLTVDGVIAASQTVTFAASPARLTAAVTLTGQPMVGQRLACGGTWAGIRGSAQYTWLREGVAITTAAGSGYTLTGADGGKHISCRSAATGFDGGVVTAPDSAATLVASKPVTLRFDPVNAKGKKVKCGATVKKTCAVTRKGFQRFIAVAVPTFQQTQKAKLVVFRKKGKRWVKGSSRAVTLGMKPLKYQGAALGKGLIRVHVEYAGNGEFAASNSGWIYLTVS